MARYSKHATKSQLKLSRPIQELSGVIRHHKRCKRCSARHVKRAKTHLMVQPSWLFWLCAKVADGEPVDGKPLAVANLGEAKGEGGEVSVSQIQLRQKQKKQCEYPSYKAPKGIP